jgi:hypothetical protein
MAGSLEARAAKTTRGETGVNGRPATFACAG